MHSVQVAAMFEKLEKLHISAIEAKSLKIDELQFSENNDSFETTEKFAFWHIEHEILSLENVEFKLIDE